MVSCGFSTALRCSADCCRSGSCWHLPPEQRIHREELPSSPTSLPFPPSSFLPLHFTPPASLLFLPLSCSSPCLLLRWLATEALLLPAAPECAVRTCPWLPLSLPQWRCCPCSAEPRGRGGDSAVTLKRLLRLALCFLSHSLGQLTRTAVGLLVWVGSLLWTDWSFACAAGLRKSTAQE